MSHKKIGRIANRLAPHLRKTGRGVRTLAALTLAASLLRSGSYHATEINPLELSYRSPSEMVRVLEHSRRGVPSTLVYGFAGTVTGHMGERIKRPNTVFLNRLMRTPWGKKLGDRAVEQLLRTPVGLNSAFCALAQEAVSRVKMSNVQFARSSSANEKPRTFSDLSQEEKEWVIAHAAFEGTLPLVQPGRNPSTPLLFSLSQLKPLSYSKPGRPIRVDLSILPRNAFVSNMVNLSQFLREAGRKFNEDDRERLLMGELAQEEVRQRIDYR